MQQDKVNSLHSPGDYTVFIPHHSNKSIQFRHTSLENESLFNCFISDCNVLTGHSTAISVGSGTRCVQVHEGV